MGTNKKANNRVFDVLFNKSVPHIFEKIFLNLDFDSFMACREVSKAWNELLLSEPFRNRPLELLQERLKEEKMKMMDKFKKILYELNEKDGDDLLWACDVKTTMAKELGMSWAEVLEAIDEHNKQEPNAEIVLWDDTVLFLN